MEGGGEKKAQLREHLTQNDSKFIHTILKKKNLKKRDEPPTPATAKLPLAHTHARPSSSHCSPTVSHNAPAWCVKAQRKRREGIPFDLDRHANVGGHATAMEHRTAQQHRGPGSPAEGERAPPPHTPHPTTPLAYWSRLLGFWRG